MQYGPEVGGMEGFAPALRQVPLFLPVSREGILQQLDFTGGQIEQAINGHVDPLLGCASLDGEPAAARGVGLEIGFPLIALLYGDFGTQGALYFGLEIDEVEIPPILQLAGEASPLRRGKVENAMPNRRLDRKPLAGRLHTGLSQSHQLRFYPSGHSGDWRLPDKIAPQTEVAAACYVGDGRQKEPAKR